MPDEVQEQQYRLAAAECLEEAKRSSDPETRRRLLIIAQKWFELANAVFAKQSAFPKARVDVATDRSDNLQMKK
jgi:hypothetical protein